jgi:hypothetical protein
MPKSRMTAASDKPTFFVVDDTERIFTPGDFKASQTDGAEGDVFALRPPALRAQGSPIQLSLGQFPLRDIHFAATDGARGDRRQLRG